MTQNCKKSINFLKENLMIISTTILNKVKILKITLNNLYHIHNLKIKILVKVKVKIKIKLMI